LGGGLAALALRGRLAATYASQNLSFVAGAAAIALLAASLATLLALALSDWRLAPTAARSPARHPGRG
ncbi:MAG: hypothetical protein ACR2ND_06765, partial [Solirubrobacteraceae bacterium]